MNESEYSTFLSCSTFLYVEYGTYTSFQYLMHTNFLYSLVLIFSPSMRLRNTISGSFIPATALSGDVAENLALISNIFGLPFIIFDWMLIAPTAPIFTATCSADLRTPL